MSKIFSAECRLNSKILALMYICWYFNYPLSIMLSMYEMYGEMSLYPLCALSMCKKIKLTQYMLQKILEESSLLYKQIIKNSNLLFKIKQLKINNPENEEIPAEPTLNLDNFSDDYKRFISEFLMENVDNIYSDVVKISFSSEDIYAELGNTINA